MRNRLFTAPSKKLSAITLHDREEVGGESLAKLRPDLAGEGDQSPVAPLDVRIRGHRVEDVMDLVERGHSLFAMRLCDLDVLLRRIEIFSINVAQALTEAWATCQPLEKLRSAISVE